MRHACFWGDAQRRLDRALSDNFIDSYVGYSKPSTDVFFATFNLQASSNGCKQVQTSNKARSKSSNKTVPDNRLSMRSNLWAAASAANEARLKAALDFSCRYASSASPHFLWNSSPRSMGSAIASSARPLRRQYASIFQRHWCMNHVSDGRNSYICNFGTARSGGQRSPYVVLQVSANASKNEIKAAFRKLAKQYHPDVLKHQIQGDGDDGDDGGDTMAELITAYETLMNKHNEEFWTDARDSRVALACQIYTIEELKSMKTIFDVHTFRVDVSGSLDENDKHRYNATTHDKSKGTKIKNGTTTGDKIDNVNQHHHLDPTPVVPLHAHPDDSVSDLKRHIQSNYATAWGLDGRRVDRDGLYLGWELVYCRNNDSIDRAVSGNDRQGAGDGSVLSYHLFLHSYGIEDGSILHAVVRKNE